MTEKQTYEDLPASHSLEELIEAERANLMQVHAMAKCLYEVLLYSDDDDGTLHADVAQVIARLIDESVSQLEKIVKRFKAGGFGLAPDASSGGADPGSSA